MYQVVSMAISFGRYMKCSTVLSWSVDSSFVFGMSDIGNGRIYKEGCHQRVGMTYGRRLME